MMWARIIGPRERKTDVNLQLVVHSDCENRISDTGRSDNQLGFLTVPGTGKAMISQLGWVLGQGPLPGL